MTAHTRSHRVLRRAVSQHEAATNYGASRRGMALGGLAAALLALASLVAGCTDGASAPWQEARGDDASNRGQVVAMQVLANPMAPGCPPLQYPAIRSMRLRLYAGAVDDPNATLPFFDSSDPSYAPDGCLSFVQCAGADVSMDEEGATPLEERVNECRRQGGQPVPATTVELRGVEKVDDATAWLELFADEACTQPVYVALRGGVSTRGGGSYALAPLCLGHFSALPAPLFDNMQLTREIAQTQCQRDCDCIDAFSSITGETCSDSQRKERTVSGASIACSEAGYCTRGYAFENILTTPCDDDTPCTALHPRARCDATAGYCTMASYFPLDTEVPRAFHAAVPTADGRIALVGGLTRHEGPVLRAGAVDVEVFDPRSMVFSKLGLAGDELGNPARAFAGVLSVEDGRAVVLAGGLSSVAVQVELKGGKRRLHLDLPPDADPAKVFSQGLALVRLTGGPVRAVTQPVEADGKPQPFALPASAIVLNRDGPEAFFAGGVAPGGTKATQGAPNDAPTVFANHVTNCVFGGVQANCLVNTGVLSTPRAGAQTACFHEDPNTGACDRYVLVGGAPSQSAPVADVFTLVENGTDVQGSFHPADTEGTSQLRTAKFARIVSAPNEGEAYFFGGTSDEGFADPADLPTMVLSLRENDDGSFTLVGQPVDAAGAPGGTQATQRTHHTATQLDNGLILVAGGLDTDNRSTASALLFDPKARRYLPDELRMTHSRFGHAATRIPSGPLRGGVLVTGGLTMEGSATMPEFVPWAEIYLPAP